MNLRSLFGVLLLALTAACATGGARSPAYDRDRISREELDERSYANLYDIVSSVRSNWLRAPMGSQSSTPLVYVDGRRMGGVEMLRSISAQAADQVRYLTATEAQSRYGMSEARPVIEVVSRGRDR